jgi:hypothetical protein
MKVSTVSFAGGFMSGVGTPWPWLPVVAASSAATAAAVVTTRVLIMGCFLIISPLFGLLGFTSEILTANVRPQAEAKIPSIAFTFAVPF